jgi:plastocyanin
MRVGVTFAVLLGACALLAGSAGATRLDGPVLTGDVGVGDGFTITLKDAAGAAVTHLDPGTYTLVVHDHSSFHNFRLSGPGVDVASDIEGVGDKTSAVTLTDGTYVFQCDPHAARMRGTFAVGSATTTTTAPTTTTTPAPTPAPAVRTKLAAVLTAGKISVRPATGLSAGSFAITVADRLATDGFRLSGPGVAKATGVAFRGTVTWRVRLQAGRYAFRSVRHPKLRGSFVVGA